MAKQEKTQPAKTEKAAVKENKKDDLFNERLSKYGAKKAWLGRIIYKAASVAKAKENGKLINLVLEEIADKYKKNIKAEDKYKAGGYIFDGFLKYSTSKAGKLNTGTFWDKVKPGDENYNKLAPLAMKAKDDLFIERKLNASGAELLRQAAAIYYALRPQPKPGSGTKAKREKAEKLINEVKGISL